VEVFLERFEKDEIGHLFDVEEEGDDYRFVYCSFCSKEMKI